MSDHNIQKVQWKPGNMVYPVPAVMVTVADQKGNSNIITIAWTGTICTNPPMAYISVRPDRYSYQLLRESGDFVINLTTEELVFATDYCGVRSGRDTDKWKATGLTPQPAYRVSAPLIAESPVNIECRVTEVKELGSHHMFLAEVVSVDVDEHWMNENGRLELNRARPIVYSHGEYHGLSELLGTFGYSVRKDARKKPKPLKEAASGKKPKPLKGVAPGKNPKPLKEAASGKKPKPLKEAASGKKPKPLKGAAPGKNPGTGKETKSGGEIRGKDRDKKPERKRRKEKGRRT